MKISDRDFNQLTEKEKRDWGSVKQKETIRIGESNFRKSCYHEYPEAVRHYLSLFPNNHLDFMLLKEEQRLRKQIQEFSNLLNSSTNGEREILNHIQNVKAYFIIASVLSEYNFGHHDAYVFPEFMLGTSYRVDYLVIGQSSGGHEFVFIEFENSDGRITRKNGDFGDVIKKGISQVCDWDAWLDANFQNLSESFNSLKNPQKNLPDEFYKLDKSRTHYAIVAGRRVHYTKKTYTLRRKEKIQRKITLLHYDNLIDLSTNLIGKNTF